MRPPADHPHPNPEFGPARGARLEPNDVLLPGDLFASAKRGWVSVHPHWHGAVMSPANAQDVVVRPGAAVAPRRPRLLTWPTPGAP